MLSSLVAQEQEEGINYTDHTVQHQHVTLSKASKTWGVLRWQIIFCLITLPLFEMICHVLGLTVASPARDTRQRIVETLVFAVLGLAWNVIRAFHMSKMIQTQHHCVTCQAQYHEWYRSGVLMILMIIGFAGIVIAFYTLVLK